MSAMKPKVDSLFPYSEPRPSQSEGMKIIREAINNNGIVPMEGACGTGKTLTALVPSLSYTLDDSTFPQRVLIVTSVKQQMTAFQDEIRRINDNRPDDMEPVTALTLVSVPDLHPFVEQGLVEEDDYGEIDRLREGTRILESDYDYDFEDLYKDAEQQSSASDKYAYAASIPELRDTEYDPYYAKYRAEKEFYDEEDKDIREMIPFSTSSAGLLTASRLREICAKEGFCPHSIMRSSLEFVDVVIGNYNHIFDPKTADRVTFPIINNETIAIFDEAHNLCPRVRDFLSQDASLTSIVRARTEVREISLIYELSRLSNSEAKRVVNEAAQDADSGMLSEKNQELADKLNTTLKENGTVMKNYTDVLDMMEDVRQTMDTMKLTPKHLDSYASYLSDVKDFMLKKIGEVDSLDEETSIQLRDPSTPDYDDLTTWTKLMNNTSKMKKAKEIGIAVDSARNKCASVNKKTSALSVGTLISNWDKKGHKRYYRSIEIEKRYKIVLEPEEEWQDDFKAKLTLHNCIPRDEISEVIDTFYSTTLMSATLEPIDIYSKTIGLDILEEDGREIYECQFGLSFPVENRETIGIPATKFKYSNKGQPFNNFGPNKSNPTRQEYYDIVYDIVSNTDGNVLLVMPNYREANWIGSLLKNESGWSSENIFIDESSSNEQTSRMRRKFFRSDNAVLTTAAGGTLIEGIDYIGDRLSCAVVCGVPLDNTSSDYMKAVRAAYDSVFEGNGFELGFTIPAIWKTRQAMGRVIRTDEDIGTRIVIDERYTEDKSGEHWDSVKRFLSDDELDELEIVSQDDVESHLTNFWD